MSDQYYPVQRIVHPRSAGLAIILSVFIPGVGSMYGGKVGIGVIIQVAYLVAFVSLAIGIGIILAPLAWAFGLWHAYHAVTEWNRAHGIIS